MHDSTDSNPYKPSSSQTSIGAGGAVLSWCALGVWYCTLLGVLAAGEMLIKTFEEFDLQLPLATSWLMSPLGVGLLAVAAVAWTIVLITMSPSSARRGMAWIALGMGIFTGLMSAFLILSPLLSLLESLS